MPHLSHSTCELWAKCPRAYQLQKIERAPQAPSTSLLLGTAVHAAIEYDGRKFIEYGYRWDEDGLVSVFADALADAITKDDPNQLISPDESADMLAKGRAIIAAYVTHLQPRYRPTAVEESFMVDIPGAPGWTFTGRIDARVELANQRPAIVDFKSASKPWPVGIEHSKDQASAYVMADKLSGRDFPAWQVMFVVFPVEPDEAGGFKCYPQFRATERTPGQLDDYTASLVDTARAITLAKQRNDFPARTGPLCAYCGVWGSCEAGKAYLARSGRKPMVPMVSKEAAPHE